MKLLASKFFYGEELVWKMLSSGFARRLFYANKSTKPLLQKYGVQENSSDNETLFESIDSRHTYHLTGTVNGSIVTVCMEKYSGKLTTAEKILGFILFRKHMIERRVFKYAIKERLSKIESRLIKECKCNDFTI